MSMPNTANANFVEKSTNTNISGDVLDMEIQAGVLPSGVRFEVVQKALTGEIDLEDSIEELSVMIAERKEQELKRIHQGHKKAMLIATVSQVQKFMEHLRKNYSMQRLEALAQRILKRASSAGQVLNMVKDEFEDPASQYMMMQFIISYGQEQEESQEKLDMVYEAMARLEEDHGDAIFAAVNAAKEGFSYGETAGEVQRFVSGYVDVALGSKTLTDILNSVLSLLQPKEAATQAAMGEANNTAQVVEKSYLDIISHLIKALGNDMDALRPSRSPERLQVVLQDLYRLQVLNSLLENCSVFAQGMEKYFHIESVSPSKLMLDLVSLSADHWVGASRFFNMPPQYEVRPITLKVIFTKGVINILKDIPIQMFENIETRNNIISAALEALDTFIIEEEEREAVEDI